MLRFAQGSPAVFQLVATVEATRTVLAANDHQAIIGRRIVCRCEEALWMCTQHSFTLSMPVEEAPWSAHSAVMEVRWTLRILLIAASQEQQHGGDPHAPNNETIECLVPLVLVPSLATLVPQPDSPLYTCRRRV